MLVVALAIAQPASPQSFKPDYDAGWKVLSKKDYATALKHWRPLAEQGNAGAQDRLGWLYHLGQGVPKDNKEAARWYRRAANQGYNPAKYSLANLAPNSQKSSSVPRATGHHDLARPRPTPRVRICHAFQFL